ncbi:putative lactoylglutathione lyase, chloroplastic [Senna tora]|uniref:Lactoylglutathione lyase n=1 Tax=Senna tora TaxID=362788 RepID=A0A834T102_9FABA|nr:putative lactoylglutathione lyase, chloroplastic [Senna tora]
MITNQLGFHLLILHFIFFRFSCKAQSSASAPSQDAISSFQPSLAVVIGILCFMFSLTCILLMYAKFCNTRASVHWDPESQPGILRTRSRFSGIDKTVIESLPFFRFSSLRGSKEGLECSVCLSKFEDIEILRLLPKCKHAFHINCIDHWLEKHSSCPLCRHKVNPEDQTIFTYSNSMRLLVNGGSELGEESNIELFVQREEEEEEEQNGSSRFNIGSSFRRILKGTTANTVKEEELPIQKEADDGDYNKVYHKHKHKITISDFVLRNRWSNVSSSDIMFLNSEMIGSVSSLRFNNLESNENVMMNMKEEIENRVSNSVNPDCAGNSSHTLKIVNPAEKRSMSDITAVSRFRDSGMKNETFKGSSLLDDNNNVREERKRQIWLPIARRTVQWFVNRENSPCSRLSLSPHGIAVSQSHTFDLKASKPLRLDGDSVRVMASGNVSQASPAATPEDVLEWVKQDKRRMLHVVYRVGDLDRTIKFYTECLGMKLLRKRDIPEERYTNAFLGYGPEDAHFVVELTYNYGVDEYDIGKGFGHFGIAVDDVAKTVELIRAKGGKITREPGPVKGGNTVIAFIEDPDGYKFELLQRGPSPEPLCQVMLRVGDLDRSIQFYEKAFGMELLRTRDNPEYKYTIAMMGYGPEDKSAVLELTYNYGVTEYDKGNAYAQIAIGTDDVYKTAEAIKLAGGKITREPGPLPGINTKITACLDPDGWKAVNFRGNTEGTDLISIHGFAFNHLSCTIFLLSSQSSSHHKMDATHKSKLPFVEQHQYRYQYQYQYPSFSQNQQTHFSNFHPLFSTMEFNEVNHESTEKGSSFTPCEEALLSGDSYSYNSYDVVGESFCAKSDTDSCSEVGEEGDDDEVSLDELLLLTDAKAKKKIEVLAEMVGVESTEPGIVLDEVVRVLKHLKRINKF